MKNELELSIKAAITPMKQTDIDTIVDKKTDEFIALKDMMRQKLQLFTSRMEYLKSDNQFMTIPMSANHLFDEIISLEDEMRRKVKDIFELTGQNN